MSIWKYFGLGPKAEVRRDEASVSNHASGIDYYPSSSGLEMRHFVNLAPEIVGEDVTVSVEASVKGTYWKDVTKLVIDAGECESLTGPIVIPHGGSVHYLLDLSGVPYPLVRFKARFHNATNSLEINLASNENGGVVLPRTKTLTNSRDELVVQISPDGDFAEVVEMMRQSLVELKKANLYHMEMSGSEVLDSDVE
jgi:hypothetical protein